MTRKFLATGAVAGMVLIGVAGLANAAPNVGGSSPLQNDPSTPTTTTTTTTTNAPYQRPGY